VEPTKADESKAQRPSRPRARTPRADRGGGGREGGGRGARGRGLGGGGLGVFTTTEMRTCMRNQPALLRCGVFNANDEIDHRRASPA